MNKKVINGIISVLVGYVLVSLILYATKTVKLDSSNIIRTIICFISLVICAALLFLGEFNKCIQVGKGNVHCCSDGSVKEDKDRQLKKAISGPSDSRKTRKKIIAAPSFTPSRAVTGKAGNVKKIDIKKISKASAILDKKCAIIQALESQKIILNDTEGYIQNSVNAQVNAQLKKHVIDLRACVESYTECLEASVRLLVEHMGFELYEIEVNHGRRNLDLRSSRFYKNIKKRIKQESDQIAKLVLKRNEIMAMERRIEHQISQGDYIVIKDNFASYILTKRTVDLFLNELMFMFIEYGDGVDSLVSRVYGDDGVSFPCNYLYRKKLFREFSVPCEPVADFSDYVDDHEGVTTTFVCDGSDIDQLRAKLEECEQVRSSIFAQIRKVAEDLKGMRVYMECKYLGMEEFESDLNINGKVFASDPNLKRLLFELIRDYKGCFCNIKSNTSKLIPLSSCDAGMVKINPMLLSNNDVKDAKIFSERLRKLSKILMDRIKEKLEVLTRKCGALEQSSELKDFVDQLRKVVDYENCVSQMVKCFEICEISCELMINLNNCTTQIENLRSKLFDKVSTSTSVCNVQGSPQCRDA